MSGIGKLMAAKIAELNPDGLPFALGVPWFTKATYLPCLGLFADAADFPRSFDAWLVEAEAGEKELRDEGVRVERIKFDPRALDAWRLANGIKSQINAVHRREYTNWLVHEILQKESENENHREK